MDEIHRVWTPSLPLVTSIIAVSTILLVATRKKGPFKGALPFRLDLLFPRCDDRLSIARYIHRQNVLTAE